MKKDNMASLDEIQYWRRRALAAELSIRFLNLQLLRGSEPTFVANHDRDIVALVERIEAIENSSSWKLTAPIRYLGELVRVRKNVFVLPTTFASALSRRLFASNTNTEHEKTEKLELTQFIAPENSEAWAQRIEQSRLSKGKA